MAQPPPQRPAFDPSPRSVDPSIPEELDKICVRAMAHAVEDRYPSAEAFRLDLEAYLAKLDTVALKKRAK